MCNACYFLLKSELLIAQRQFGVECDLGLALIFLTADIIEGGGNYGFLNIQKGSENGKNHIGAATIRIGYAFNISK